MRKIYKNIPNDELLSVYTQIKEFVENLKNLLEKAGEQ